MYSNATIKRARTIIANVEHGHTNTATRPSYAASVVREMQARSPRQPHTQTRTIAAPVDNRDRDAVMATKVATIGQMRRINRCYKDDGLREFDTLASFREVFPTMLAASIEWRILNG